MDKIERSPDIQAKTFYTVESAIQHIKEHPEEKIHLRLAVEVIDVNPSDNPYNYEGGEEECLDAFLIMLKGRPIQIDTQDPYEKSRKAFEATNIELYSEAKKQGITIATQLIYIKEYGYLIPVCEISIK